MCREVTAKWRGKPKPLSYEEKVFTRSHPTRKPLRARQSSTTDRWFDGNYCLLLRQKLGLPFSAPGHNILHPSNPWYLFPSPLQWRQTLPDVPLQIKCFPRILQLSFLFSILSSFFRSLEYIQGTDIHIPACGHEQWQQLSTEFWYFFFVCYFFTAGVECQLTTLI